MNELENERIKIILEVASNAPKEHQTAIRAAAVLGKTYPEIKDLSNGEVTRGMYDASALRNVWRNYKGTQDLKFKVIRNLGIHLLYLQIIISFIICKSYPSCQNQRGQSKLYHSIPDEFRRNRQTMNEIPILFENEAIVSELYKRYLTAEGHRLEELLFDK
ncbi:MAG: hypothetical protein EZS28_017129 [Streblomastix strix]|uniref:Uncharacterized protein n=1 Tax=Streblomastix strix TaxID=222440 RepID=A0A5J4VYQ5_9EUKA|nr:MAG: hypothetical protein EZS28_017129 [Streblomastix strix]